MRAPPDDGGGDNLQRSLEELSAQLVISKRACQQAVAAGDQAINMAAGLAQEMQRLQVRLERLGRETNEQREVFLSEKEWLSSTSVATVKVPPAAPISFTAVVPGEGLWLSTPGSVPEDNVDIAWWASGGLATNGIAVPLRSTPAPPGAAEPVAPPLHADKPHKLSTRNTGAKTAFALEDETIADGDALPGDTLECSTPQSADTSKCMRLNTTHTIASVQSSSTAGTLNGTEMSGKNRHAAVFGSPALNPREGAGFEVLPIFAKLSSNRIVAPGSLLRFPSKATLPQGGTHAKLSCDSTAVGSLKWLVWMTRWQALVIHPYDRRRVCWDVMSLLLVLYDAIAIPLQVLEPPENFFTLCMSWITRMFWSLDMPISCVSGFVCSNGDVMLHPLHILKRYAQTWFSLDLLVVSVDWVELAISDPSSGVAMAKYGRVGRSVRLLRMIRLLRLLRMREVLSFLVERIQSESVVIGMNILQILLVITFTAHLMSCFWCVVGTLSETPAWIEATGYDAMSLDIRYAVSLHWSLSQFTGGMDEVTPGMGNRSERVYAIVAWLLAFMFAAGFLSSLTSSMTQLYILTSADHDKLSALRRWLVQMDISKSLSARVRRNAQHAFSEQTRHGVNEQSIVLLVLVSEPLRMEVHFEMFRPTMALHPFFAHYIRECPQVMRRVCHTAVKVSLVSYGDVLFHIGEVPAEPKMYFVCTGELAYLSEGTAGGAMVPTIVEEHQWLAEPVLWTRWTHRGVLTVARDSRICTVDAQAFHDIIGQFEHQDFDPKHYATDFVTRLNSECLLSDLWTCPSDLRHSD